MKNILIEYMKANKIPLTRKNYQSLNTMGDGTVLEGENLAEVEALEVGNMLVNTESNEIN